MFFLYILLGIVILLLMVVIHEFGHYIAGKILNFKIDEFSVGFGPKLLQKKSKKSGEKFTLRLIPLGGYCAFAGEDNADGTTIGKKSDSGEEAEVFAQTDNSSLVEDNSSEDASDTGIKPKRDYLLFDEQKPWKRIIVFIAGPLLNFVSAIIFSFIFIFIVGYAHPVVDYKFAAADGSYYTQLELNDEIVAVNGKRVGIMNNYSELMSDVTLGDDIVLTVLRDGSELDVPVEIQRIVSVDRDGEPVDYSGIGIQSKYEYESVGVGNSLLYCVPMTFKFSWMILGAFGKLFTGQVSITSLTGPIGTVSSFAEVASQNWLNILIWLPLIASNLAIFNILPVPALDGSKVVFTVIEWIRGKPVNKKVENIIHFAGLVALFGLVIVVDIIGMFTRGF